MAGLQLDFLPMLIPARYQSDKFKSNDFKPCADRGTIGV